MNNIPDVEQDKLAALQSELNASTSFALETADTLNAVVDLAGSLEIMFGHVEKAFSQALIQTAVANSARTVVESVLKSEKKRVVELELGLEELNAAADNFKKECVELSSKVKSLTDAKLELTKQVWCVTFRVEF